MIENKMYGKKNIKTGFELLVFFLKIGCFTFGGGWSILAQMEQEFVHKRGWITKEELIDLSAVAKSVPGIMITNICMLFGYQMAGWFGGVCSVIGISLSPVLILTAVTFGYDMIKNNYWCSCMLEGIQAAIAPIIGSVAVSLGKDILRNRKGILICLATFLMCVWTDVSNIVLVIIGVLAAFLERRMKKHGVS